MSRRVLIVEDDPRIARAFARGLRGFGWEPTVVGTVAEAEEAQHGVDVILTDWSVGGADVVDRAVRPVVVCTGDPAVEDVGVAVVRKPVDMEELHAALDAAHKARRFGA